MNENTNRSEKFVFQTSEKGRNQAESDNQVIEQQEKLIKKMIEDKESRVHNCKIRILIIPGKNKNIRCSRMK